MKQTHHIGYVQTPSVKNLSNVKNALVENGLVPITTPNEMLPDAIEKGLENLKPENVRGNVKIGNVVGSIATTIDEVNVEEKVKRVSSNNYDYSYKFVHSNGIDMYASYGSSSKQGLWHINLQTGTVSTLLAKGYSFKHFFEDSFGGVCISSSMTKGLYRCVGATIKTIMTTGYTYTNFYNNKNGITYFSSTDTNTVGLYLLNQDTKTQIYNLGRNWGNFIEDDNGCIYSSTNYHDDEDRRGIIYINNDIVTKIHDEGSSFEYYFKAKNGNIYVSSTDADGSGIVLLKNGSATKIYDQRYRWRDFIESSSGYIYAGSTTSSSGIVCIKDNIAEQVVQDTTGIYSITFSGLKNGDVYASAANSKGSFYLKENTAVSLGAITLWLVAETNDNKAYGIFGDGVYKVNGSNTEKISTITGSHQQYLCTKNNDIYVSSFNTTSGAKGILHIKDDVVTQLVPDTSFGINLLETTEGVLASETKELYPSSTVLLLVGNVVYELK